jgi:hypothetical protein
MGCQQGAHLFEVGLQRVFLGALFFKFALLLQVSPGSLNIYYTYYPAYCGYDQGEDLDNVFTICSTFFFWVDVPNQYPPKPDANNYKHDKPKDYRYRRLILNNPAHDSVATNLTQHWASLCRAGHVKS